MILTQSIRVSVKSKTSGYFKSIGYEIPSSGYFDVKIEDYPFYGSRILVERQCDNCGKIQKVTFPAYKSSVRNGKCYCKACTHQLFFSAQNHYKWNWNKTEEERDIERKYPEYYQFIKSVMARDNYKCKICGKHNNRLIVHHLDGYAWCKERRTDTTNGITLCTGCHNKFHTAYGKGSNTREQFEAFFNIDTSNISDYEYTEPKREIICVETKEVFENSNTLRNLLGVVSQKVYHHLHNSCYKDGNLIAKHLKGKHYIYKDEYDNMSDEDICDYLDQRKLLGRRKVLCITTGEAFEMVADAARKYQVAANCISRCCRNKSKYAGTLPSGEKLAWEYI